MSITLNDVLVLTGTPGAIPDDKVQVFTLKSSLSRVAKAKRGMTRVTLQIDTDAFTPGDVLRGQLPWAGCILLWHQATVAAAFNDREMDPAHPASVDTLRQLAKLHGWPKLLHEAHQLAAMDGTPKEKADA